MKSKECEVSTVEVQEGKYANIDLDEVYEYADLSDKIAGRCD